MKCKDMQPWPTLKATSLRGASARSPWKRPRCGQPHLLDRGQPVTRVVMTPSPVIGPRSTSTTARNHNLQALHKLSQRSQEASHIFRTHTFRIQTNTHVYHDGKNKYMQFFPLGYSLSITVTVGVAERN